MGRWSASHRKTAILGWLAFVIAAIVIGTAVGSRTIGQNNNNTVDPSQRADQILKHCGFPRRERRLLRWPGAVARVAAP